MREEGAAAAVRARLEEAEVRLEELVEEPEAKEEPGRDSDREDPDQPQHLRARIEREVRAEEAAIAPLAPRFGTRASAVVPIWWA